MRAIFRRRVLIAVVLAAVVGGVVLGLTATNGRTARDSTPPTERGEGQARNQRPPHPLARKIRASRDTSSCNYACTPPNQDALDADASDGQRIAGRSLLHGSDRARRYEHR